jgi:hypothetical protein
MLHFAFTESTAPLLHDIGFLTTLRAAHVGRFVSVLVRQVTRAAQRQSNCFRYVGFRVLSRSTRNALKGDFRVGSSNQSWSQQV